MARDMGKVIAAAIDRLVRGVVVPVTSAIPALVSHGVLLITFAALWLGFGVALAADQGTLEASWHSLGQLPLPIQAIVWLLLLPLMVGLWVWASDWPLVVRLVLIGGIAAWNLLVFVPRAPTPTARVAS